MQITLKPIDLRSPDYQRAKKLYLSAFPREERAPFFILKSRAKRPCAELLGIYDENRWIGLMYVILHIDLAYVFYFAIADSERGKGYGHGAIAALKERYVGNQIFLAIEQLDSSAENYKERVRRKNFYLNCGLEDLHMTVKEGGVTFDLLGINGAVDPDKYKTMMHNYLGWSGRLLYPSAPVTEKTT